MNRWTVLFACVLAAALLALGCSGSNTPVTPNNGLTEREITSGPTTQTHLWGYYDIYIDVENQTVEAVPNRNVAFTANVVGFVNKPATNLQFDIWGTPVALDESFIDVDIDVSITHPFPGLNQYDGYDVRGIFMGIGSESLNYDPDLVYAMQGGTDQVMYDYDLGDDPDIGYDDPYDGLVGMPDGFTRWWNPEEFGGGVLGYIQGKLATPGYEDSITATLNPYKYYADGLNPDDDVYPWLVANAADDYFVQGVFTAGSTNTRNYYLRFPTPDPHVNYGYAIAADWGEHEAADPPPAESHMVETPAISVTIEPDLYFVDNTIKGGDFIADIDIWSWDYQPATVIIEPNFHSANVAATGPTGGDDNFSTWSVEFTPDNLTQLEGNEYWVIAEYTDFDYTAKGTEYSVGTEYPDAPLAAFFKMALWVSPDPYCLDLQPTLETLNGVATYIGTADAMTDLELVGTNFEEGPGLAVDVMQGSTLIVSGTNVVWVDITTVTFDVDMTGQAGGSYDIRLTNGCGDMLQVTKTGMLALLQQLVVVGTPNINVGSGMIDIAIDPSMDRVCINRGQTWTKYEANYTISNNYPFWGGGNYPAGKCDVQAWGVLYPFLYNGQYCAWCWGDWFGSVPGGWYWTAIPSARDFCNIQGTSTIAGIYDAANYSYYIYMESSGYNVFPSYYMIYPPFYNGTGNSGVVGSALLATDYMNDTTSRRMYFLENLLASNTAVVERYVMSTSPTFQIAFGQGLLYNNALDITVDSSNNIWVLEKNVNAKPVIWVWDVNGNLFATSGEISAANCSGNPLRIDAALAPTPDEVHLVHTAGVTKFSL